VDTHYIKCCGNKMKHWKPLFIENSKVPIWLSKFAPIEIGAITAGPVVFSRGKISESTRRHETIHFQQYLETLFIGFLLLYVWYFLGACIKYGFTRKSYLKIKFEQEAHANDKDVHYLNTRKRYCWLKYTI